MFEDVTDIDEILNNYESTNSLKRFNTDLQEETSCKRPKIKPVTHPEDVGNSSKDTDVKKLFRFKKNAAVNNEVIAVKWDVNNISHCRIETVPELCRNEVKEIVRNESYSELLEQTKVQNEPIATHSGLTNVDQHVEKNSVARSENDRSNIKRRFPGPAGLLPERIPSNSLLENLNDSSKIEMKGEICTQSSSINFNEQSWGEMLKDFKTDVISLPEKYNIQWIKSRTVMKKLINQKTPFLAAFIDRIRSHSIQNPIVNVVLKDKTGTIQGTILHNLYEEHSSNLNVGSVIVLKEIGVLNTGPSEEPYLTITRNNLVSIYSNKNKIVDGSSQSSSEISKTILQNLSAEEILNRIYETKRIHKLANTSRNIGSVSLMNKDMTGPKNLSDTFRKVVQNVKSSSSPKTPNLSVLTTKSIPSNSSMNSSKRSVSSPSGNKNKIEDISEFFDTQEDLDEFFADEPIHCSTQKGTIELKDVHRSIETKMEVCSDENPETSRIFEDMFEGVDANALFDEF